MATYLILNIIFLTIVALLMRFRFARLSKAWWLTIAGLVVLTTVFDNILILLDIVGYDHTKLLGIYVGLAPIEDYFYIVLAALLVPSLWDKFEGRNHHAQDS